MVISSIRVRNVCCVLELNWWSIGFAGVVVACSCGYVVDVSGIIP